VLLHLRVYADNQIVTLAELDTSLLTNLHTLELRGNRLSTLHTAGINIPSLKNLFLASIIARSTHCSPGRQSACVGPRIVYVTCGSDRNETKSSRSRLNESEAETKKLASKP